MPDATVWIDDPHPIFRRGLRACLRSDGFRVMGDSVRLEPTPSLDAVDVLLFAAERQTLRHAVRLASSTDTALVALVSDPLSELVSDAVESGVAAVLPRAELLPATLATTLRAVLHGGTALPAKMLRRLLDRAATSRRGASDGLTGRELEVLRLLAQGDDTRAIATELSYSERTVKNVVHDVLVKMNCRNRAHAVALATRQGVI
ncbi:MAG: response regulator transcription factor [Actinobacteria bacterium]|nr:response regulator transcription factor [Actinomycetota bacterium]